MAATPTTTPTAADRLLTSNYNTGRPGSFFTFNGSSFTPNYQVEIRLRFEDRERVLGTVQSSAVGTFSFILDTWQAVPGDYIITASDNVGQDEVTLELQGVFLLREQQGSGLILYVMSHIYAPVIVR